MNQKKQPSCNRVSSKQSSLTVWVIKSEQKNCESWRFKEVMAIGFMVDGKWFGDGYLIINEAFFYLK